MRRRSVVTAESLTELLRYEAETGYFYWRVNRSGTARAGTRAGRTNHLGYIQIGVLGGRYSAHRLAWLYVHGTWPAGFLDHINGDKKDNRIVNLRVVSSRQNQQNRNTHRAGRLVGCSYHKGSKRWQAQLLTSEGYKYLGLYATEQEAHDAYMRAASENT